jgi:hypothetical protein
VELDADALRADDTRHFAVRVAPPPAVAVRGEGGPFLAAALATLVDEQRLARGREGERGVVTIGSADAADTRKPVLLTAPRDPVRLGEANRQLARLGIPWRFGAIARATVLARVPGSASTDTAAAATRAFDGAPVRLRYPLLYSPGENTGSTADRPDTIATAGGAPWVVAGADYVLLGSPLEPEATDLPLRAAFVPWVLEALARRLGDEGRLLTAAPGSTLSGLRDLTALEAPDGSLLPLSGDRATVPASAGVYFLRRQAARVGALVVNPEPEESAFEPMPAGGADALLARMLRGQDVASATTVAEWQRAVFSRAAGQALLLPLVALALLALMAEAWVSRR